MQYCSYSIRLYFHHQSHPQLFLLWLHPFILSGVISSLISSNILGIYRPGEFLFQYSIILPFHTVRGVLKARILKWLAIPFSMDHFLSDLSTMTLRIRNTYICSGKFSSVQSLSRVRLFVNPWIAACQASLSITNSQSSLKLLCVESVMPSSHLILCCPLLLLPPIPPNIRVFSNESTLYMRWPKYWRFSHESTTFYYLGSRIQAVFPSDLRMGRGWQGE